VNTVEYRQVLGRRVAREHRHHGLSQPVAEAPLPELAAGGPGGADELKGSSAADSLRLLLAGAHSLCAMLGESYAPSIDSLRTATERACALASLGDFDQLAPVLGRLLPGLEAAARTMPQALRADAYELTAKAYQACSAALMKLGEPLAAWVAADRALAAAERAGNVVLAAAGQYRLASVLLDSGYYPLADEIARTSMIALRGLAELDDPDALSLCGGLTVLRAMVAARTCRAAAAFGYLATARLLASRLGTRQAAGMPEFCAQHVALAEIAVSVDLGDAEHALRAAASVDTASLPPGQMAGMLVDVARAYALRQQVDEATAALARAVEVEPDRPADHDRTRQVIGELLGVHTPPPLPLVALAERVGAVPP
jgi:tetratricopeptide (TPR) repeat protein